MLSTKDDRQSKRIAELEKETNETKRKLSHALKHIEDLEQIVQFKTREAQQIAEDIQTVTKENQFLNTELIKISQEAECYKSMNNDLSLKEKKGQQTLRSIEMEKTDILNAYKKLAIDNERLNEGMKVAIHENQDIFGKAQLIDQDNCMLRNQLAENQAAAENYIAEISMRYCLTS